RTSAVALLAGLLICAAYLWSRRGAKPIKTGGSTSTMAICMSVLFLGFAVREFSQVIFVANDSIRVLSRNNLGDICLHLTHINYLGSSPRYWPDNPIFAFDKLRYPIGLNL